MCACAQVRSLDAASKAASCKCASTARSGAAPARRALRTAGSRPAGAAASAAAGTGLGAASGACAGRAARARPATRQCTLEPPKPKLEMATVPPCHGVASATTWDGRALFSCCSSNARSWPQTLPHPGRPAWFCGRCRPAPHVHSTVRHRGVRHGSCERGVLTLSYSKKTWDAQQQHAPGGTLSTPALRLALLGLGAA